MTRGAEGSSQDMTNMLWACATVSFVDKPSLNFICSQAQRLVAAFKPQELANSLWALATTSFQHELVLPVVRQSMKTVHEFRAQNLANFVWAYAKLNNRDHVVLQGVKLAVFTMLESFSIQDLVSTIWAFSTASHRDDSLIRHCISRFGDTSAVLPVRPQHASNLMWAMAVVQCTDRLQFECLCTRVMDRLTEFKPQELANVAWALATVTMKHARTIQHVSRQTLDNITEFSPQSVANFIWAYAKLGCDEDSVVSCVKGDAALKLGRFSEQDLSTVLWALSTVQHRDDNFLRSWTSTLLSKPWLQAIKPQHVSNILWSMAVLPFHDVPCFDSLTTSAARRLSSFTGQDIACIAWACASVLHRDRVFADHVAHHVVRSLGNFDQQSVGMIAWGLSQMDTEMREVYHHVFEHVSKDSFLSECNAQVFSEVSAGFFRSGEAPLAWKLFDRVIEVNADPGINALGLWLHHCRHRCPDLSLEVRLLECLAKHRPCRRLATVVLNAIALRFEELGFFTLAQDVLGRIAEQGMGDPVTRLISERVQSFDDLNSCETRLWCPISWSTLELQPKFPCDYNKECEVLQHVFASARIGDAFSVVESIERFSIDGHGWLKIAGDGKGAVLDELIQTCASPSAKVVLEFGCYVGYSATRMARLLQSRGGRVISVEVDPVHACIARSMLEYAGLAKFVSIHVGYTEEAIPHLHSSMLAGSLVDVVFMDQRGTRFHLDLEALEAHAVLSDNCVIAADNVLKPGAPQFLWKLHANSCYSLIVISLREFASEQVEDWICIARCCGSTGERNDTRPAELPPPESLEYLAFRADRIRRKACSHRGPDDVDVSEAEWARHAQEMRRGYCAAGIFPRIVHVRRGEDGRCFVDWDGDKSIVDAVSGIGVAINLQSPRACGVGSQPR
eukprot:TRINITY_DN35530_c0_g2_i1.p1 TRINITY_DN35530_c0_g2~~TRINITY_DN35530_c0_g2_i1.p1  ORF type:complete len:937 (-),score=117.99 TRINITY_DN35530_c0_g2_i1:48-2759(-)